MSRFFPMPAYYDMMPVDISFVFEDEKPAGKHGFLKADGAQMRFEDGTVARFWGVNFNGGACFPDKDYAQKVARRLAQSGCNIVRMHQLDAEWDTPNLFAFTKGKRVTTTRVLDERSLDALDYLIYCLKQEGIYVYLDMITYRKFKEGDDVPFCELLQEKACPFSLINRRLIDLQKEYCTQLWTHYNPYTQLEYRNDPAIVMTEITNEGDMFIDTGAKKVDHVPIPYYINEFRQMLKTWLEENNMEYDWENCDLFANDEPMILFKVEMTKRFFREMRQHMIDLGVKIPIAGTNWNRPQSGHTKAHEEMDFVDTHDYLYEWRWGNTERICRHNEPVALPCPLGNAAVMQLPNKPLVISEWDVPWPNSYRAEGPVYMAALACLQEWSGCIIHTYAYTSRLWLMDKLGQELSAPVGGIPYREGIFSTWNDPAKFGLFYHCALMLRRGDIAPANKKVAINAADLTKNQNTAVRSLMGRHRCATVFDNKIPEGYDELIQNTEAYPNPNGSKIIADNGQLWRDTARQVGGIDTPRTKGVFGRMGWNNNRASTQKQEYYSVSLDGMEVTCFTDFGVVILSSLTDDPIETSDNMLLTTIGRARNTDAQFDGDKMVDVGRAPIMAEIVEANITIRNIHAGKLNVWGITPEGFYGGKMPTTAEDGKVSFHVGDEANPAAYYLITKE